MARDRVAARQRLIGLLEDFCEREWRSDGAQVVDGVIYVMPDDDYGRPGTRMRFNVGRLADELLAKAEDGKLDYLVDLAPVKA